jgi:FAD/FMN-containing dehydrogenase
MMATMERALAALSDIETALGPKTVRRRERVSALDPGWHPHNLTAGAMTMPASTDEVVEVVRICESLGVPLVPQGGRTGLVGGGVSKPGEIVLSLERMNLVERIDPQERVAVAGAGVTLQSLQEAAAPFGLAPGIDLAARGQATLGGMASTNAGGIMAFRNGVMRHQILGLEAVLPNGEIYSDLTRVVKVTAGYDLKHLLIGAEGTLGVITRLVLKLEPKPEAEATALLALPSFAAALAAIDFALRSGHLRAAEAMSRAFLNLNAAAQGFREAGLDESQPLFLLISLGGENPGALRDVLESLYVEIASRFSDVSGVIAESGKQARDLWRLREDTLTIYRAYPQAPSYDVSVPISEIETYVTRVEAGSEELGLRPFIFGHLADGNLHVIYNHAGAFPSALERSVEDLLYRGLAALGGAFSAEHGVGSKRIGALQATVDPGKLALMAIVKRALDPSGLMNPGKLFASP